MADMVTSEIASHVGVSLPGIEALMRGEVTSEIATHLGVDLPTLKAFIDGRCQNALFGLGLTATIRLSESLGPASRAFVLGILVKGAATG